MLCILLLYLPDITPAHHKHTRTSTKPHSSPSGTQHFCTYLPSWLQSVLQIIDTIWLQMNIWINKQGLSDMCPVKFCSISQNDQNIHCLQGYWSHCHGSERKDRELNKTKKDVSEEDDDVQCDPEQEDTSNEMVDSDDTGFKSRKGMSWSSNPYIIQCRAPSTKNIIKMTSGPTKDRRRVFGNSWTKIIKPMLRLATCTWNQTDKETMRLSWPYICDRTFDNTYPINPLK